MDLQRGNGDGEVEHLIAGAAFCDLRLPHRVPHFSESVQFPYSCCIQILQIRNGTKWPGAR